ncbi:MAG: HAD-IIA family hydrolase [Chloroflexota bacterium]
MICDLFDAFLLDLDGAVYVGERATPGAPEAIAEMRHRGKTVIFISNDSRAPRAEYAAKLSHLGIPTTAEDVLTSSAATALYIQEHHDLAGKTAFGVGSPAFKDELRQVGLALVEGEEARAADFVVTALSEDFDYDQMRTAALAVRRGAHFYTVNRDPTFPMPDGLWPAAGAVTAAVETAGGRPAVAVGKPETAMFEIALRRLPTGTRAAIVGDTLGSDILGGQRAGIKTILVLTGNTKEEDLATATVKPDYVLPALSDIVFGSK